MEIIENREAWQAAFEAGWMRHFTETGETDFSRYGRIGNETAPAGPPIDLSKSKLALISSAGGYMTYEQEAFDAANPLGDYSLRRYPSDIALGRLSYAHTHYDHAAVDSDPQVLIPLLHLADMVNEGMIGSLAAEVVSFTGYLPDAARLVDETIPQIVGALKEMEVDAALLVPA